MIARPTNKIKTQLGGCLLLALAAATLVGCSKPENKAAAKADAVAASSESPKIADDRTALDEYIAAPDTNYTYRVIKTVPGKTQTTFIVDMTSQAWLTTNEVDHPLWKHWVIIVKPNEVTTSKSLLFISGGGNGGEPPQTASPNLIQVALATKSVVTELKMVPNQPIVFAGETEGRKEDSLIAYTWDKFLRTGDKKWPARLPMTKSAVRAMDTVTSVCGSAEGGNLKIDGFVVAGGSKRGWTTWTTAAVDKRVVAIVPLVIDVLNIEPSMMHHYGAYGFWAPAVGNYTAFKIMDWNGTPEYKALMKIEEPYQYRQRLTMPKFIVNGSGDQFFLPDSSQFYFNDLPGTKYLRYVPNADHSLSGSDAYLTLQACYNAVLYNVPLPEFSWTVEKDGSLRVTSKTSPSEVKLWQANNPAARDFRFDTLGRKYQSSALPDQGGGVYVGKIQNPVKGWTAFFVELTYANGSPAPFKFTTQVRVLPDTLPFKFEAKGRPL